MSDSIQEYRRRMAELRAQLDDARKQEAKAKEERQALRAQKRLAREVRKQVAADSAIINTFVTFPRGRHADMLGKKVRITLELEGTFGVTGGDNVGFAVKNYAHLSEMKIVQEAEAAE